jgi:hypothetical protein
LNDEERFTLTAAQWSSVPKSKITRESSMEAETYSAASLGVLFLGLPPAFFSTGARNLPV